MMPLLTGVHLPVKKKLLLAALCLQAFVDHECLFSSVSYFPHFANSKMGLSMSEVGYVYAATPLCCFFAVLLLGAFDVSVVSIQLLLLYNAVLSEYRTRLYLS
jgi:hypothetical protein